MALVRMRADRTKAQFNNLAGRIERSWNEIVSYDDGLHVETVENKEKKLRIVSCAAIITGRENGVYLPNVRFSLFFSSLSIFTVVAHARTEINAHIPPIPLTYTQLQCGSLVHHVFYNTI